ncbi:GNAT family N-acetyltransferase [Helicovermis profundi]|uniref:GNAT family N-acetyltransferase n=1 Tax=Helicovermis profundi TaxID=3065157 RepID=A0AAU9EFG4_9FIRM|nr:GNAT family N-acetyltransferase [Clostridia bacterium S502]
MYISNRNIGNNKNYTLRLLNDEYLEEIQNLCNNCSDYYLLDKGSVADSDAAQKILEALPNGKTYDDQFNLGIFNKSNSLIGLINIIKDYPYSNVWMLGLLMIDPSERNNGLGKLIHKEIVNIVKEENANKIRIGVLKDNINALKFWNSIGYKLEKETEIDRGNNIIKKVLVFNYSV